MEIVQTNHMNRFFTLLLAASSLSAFGQLPYNPDANDDGHIGAVDLTALLSVYSGNFSNGVLSDGTVVVTPEVFNIGWYVGDYFLNEGATSFVIDLNILKDIEPNAADWGINVFGSNATIVNGSTLTILYPGDFKPTIYWGLYDETTGSFEIDPSASANRFVKWVWWNGEWFQSDW